jgi:hypothetical protein
MVWYGVCSKANVGEASMKRINSLSTGIGTVVRAVLKQE